MLLIPSQPYCAQASAAGPSTSTDEHQPANKQHKPNPPAPQQQSPVLHVPGTWLSKAQQLAADVSVGRFIQTSPYFADPFEWNDSKSFYVRAQVVRTGNAGTTPITKRQPARPAAGVKYHSIRSLQDPIPADASVLMASASTKGMAWASLMLVGHTVLAGSMSQEQRHAQLRGPMAAGATTTVSSVIRHMEAADVASTMSLEQPQAEASCRWVAPAVCMCMRLLLLPVEVAAFCMQLVSICLAIAWCLPVCKGKCIIK